MSSRKALYKVTFINHGKSYEIYAKQVSASDLYGFILVSDLQFATDSLVVDPVEEKLKEEFGNTQALHLPMHAVVRVEEVRERAAARIRDSAGDKVVPFSLGPAR
jgi:hypothetical protein